MIVWYAGAYAPTYQTSILVYLAYLIDLYMLRAIMCPSSGETIVFMRHLVLAILKQVDSWKLQERISYNEECKLRQI